MKAVGAGGLQNEIEILVRGPRLGGEIAFVGHAETRKPVLPERLGQIGKRPVEVRPTAPHAADEDKPVGDHRMGISAHDRSNGIQTNRTARHACLPSLFKEEDQRVKRAET